MGSLILLALSIWHWPLGIGPEPVFTSPSGLVFNQVKPDKTADFEAVVARLRAGLRSSADPARRKQAESWRVYKASEPYQGSVLYVFVIDPAIPAADYSITRVLAETSPAEVQDMYAKFRAACTAQTFWSLAPVAASPSR